MMRDRLLDIYDRLYDHYGPQHWWPGDSRFEMMVGAVLTQAAAWTNVEKAISNLVAADVMSPRAIRDIGQASLARLVHPSGYFNSKARKLRALAMYLGERFDDDLDDMLREDAVLLREELLGVYGIGEETADDILLYALGVPTFIVDNYTRRVFSRLGLAPDKTSYSLHRSLFMDHLPTGVELFQEYHALIVRHGKEACRKKPRCHGCPLLKVCPTGEKEVAGDPQSRQS